MAPKKDSIQNVRKRRQPEKHSDEYLKKRERNNVAVKKSRQKSRVKQKETLQLVMQLREENADLEEKVTILSKELDVLKCLFLSHAAAVKEEVEKTVSHVCVKAESSDFDSVDGISPPNALIDHEYCS